MKFLLCLLFTAALHAGSVKLVNDSAYKLRAVIRASDGSYLGEVLVNPQQTMSWNDYGNGSIQYNAQSLTPYSVTWYCADGNDFSVCGNVATGSMVSAMSCSGTRACKGKKPPPNPNKRSQTEEYLQPAEPTGPQTQGVGPPGGGSVGPP